MTFVYFVRWSIYNNDKLFLSGQGEYKMKEFISNMNHIAILQSQICAEVLKKRISTKENDEVLIDFYSLMRKEE